jgi:hypothetical protein
MYETQEPTHNYMLSPYGSPYGLTIGQEPCVENLNTRIFDRCFPDMDLQPNFDPRPVSTKYTIFSIVDSYNHTEVFFNPGNAKAPVSGFLKKVDLESDLRNQNCRLEKYDLGNKYTPNPNSDMFRVTVPQQKGENLALKEHPLLFEYFSLESSTDEFTNEYNTVGQQKFNNCTRTQIRSTSV